MINFLEINNDVIGQVRREKFSGYDPFDFLNSSFLKRTKLNKNKWIRLAWLQLGKHLPLNVRPFLGVPRKRNPKGISLFILGMLEDYKRTGIDAILHEAIELADWLILQRSEEALWSYSCWGYHFDWQARAFFVPEGKPNIITTCYVAQALYCLGKITGHSNYVEIALDSAYFIQRHLLNNHTDRIFFSYIPGETTFVHNASLWGAAWVGKAGVELSDSELQETALRVARQSVKAQRENGAWVYGERHHHQFIDGFHTGYNLEALDMLRKALDIDEFDESIQRGLDYYRETFFLEDGTAKYYHNNMYPLDMHNFSQGVLTLLKIGGTIADVTLAEKVMHRAAEILYLPKEHRFIYQKNQWYSNKINYIRWTQAWAYYSLAYFNRYMAEYKNETH